MDLSHHQYRGGCTVHVETAQGVVGGCIYLGK